MDHVFYLDANTEKISCVIQTDDSIIDQNREHVEIYKNKVTDLQSKYIALHVGLFWGIGIFIIKNEDTIKIKLDERIMYDQFTSSLKIGNEFIQKRMQLIRQLIEQQKLKAEFEMVDADKNLAKKILMQKSLRPKTISYLVTAYLRCLIMLRVKFIKEVVV